MSQLTTVAALPSGCGQAAHLRPEVGEARKPETDCFAPGRIIWCSERPFPDGRKVEGEPVPEYLAAAGVTGIVGALPPVAFYGTTRTADADLAQRAHDAGYAVAVGDGYFEITGKE